jgi:hypothetical protein
MKNPGTILVGCLLSMAVSLGWCAEPPKLQDLVEASPLPANAIAYLHPPSLAKLIREANLPPQVIENVDELWMIADLEIPALQPRWEAGYSRIRKALTAANLASAVEGYVDSVADRPVVWSPKQTYLFLLDEQLLGFLRPAHRSALARWLRRDGKIPPSDYLLQQAKQPEAFLSFMLAIDLRDIFSPLAISHRLKSFHALDKQSPTDAADFLASVHGLSLIVGRRSLQECILSVEFDRSPAVWLPIAKDLLAEILETNGVAAPEVRSWSVRSDGHTVVFQGPISQPSLDGVLQIFSLGDQAEDVARSLEAQSPSKGSDPTGYASKKYFDQVLKLIGNVRDYEVQSTGSRARWNDLQARRMDELGTLNVAPEVVEYGATVAELLRNNALTIRSTNIAAGQAKARQRASGGYDSSYDANSISAGQGVTDAQARGMAYTDYAKVLAKIDGMTAELRRSMTAKYRIQF